MYSEDNLNSGKADMIHSLIMETADDIASHKLELTWDQNKKIVVENEEGELIYTEEAQEEFNEFYDEEITKLYSLINSIIEIHDKN
jgi:glutathionyl-hydroquinone reductase